jgi:large subunit ribosomal protein L24
MRLKKNDLVIVLTGRDKGRQGKVLELLDGRERVRIEGINMVKRHVKGGQDPKAPQGGIIEAAAPIHISNVRLVCGHCSQPTIAKVRKLEDGKQRRYCPKCNESVDTDK